MSVKFMLRFSILSLITTFLLLYANSLPQIIARWSSPDFSHCFLVPFISAFFAYTKRHQIRSIELQSSAWGWSILFFAGILLLGGLSGLGVTLISVSLWLCVVGLVVTLLGWRGASLFGFPLVILAFIVTPPPFLNWLLTFKLKLLASNLASTILELSGKSIHRAGNIIELPNIQLQVVEACSGLHYLYSLLLLGLVVSYISHRNWSKRLVVIVFTVPLALFANSLRIVGTGWLSQWMSEERLEGLFHNFFGIFVFIFSTVALFLISSFLHLIKKRSRSQSELGQDAHRRGSRHASIKVSPAHVGGAVLIMVLILGFTLKASTHRALPPRLSFQDFPSIMGQWYGQRSFLTQQTLKVLSADDYVDIGFTNHAKTQSLRLFVPYYTKQMPGSAVHSPITCLIGSGWTPRSRRIITLEFPQPLGRSRIVQAVFEKEGQLLLLNYWFQGRGKIFSSEIWNRLNLFVDFVRIGRNDGALVRVEMFLNLGQRVEEAQEVLDGFVAELVTILPKYVPN